MRPATGPRQPRERRTTRAGAPSPPATRSGRQAMSYSPGSTSERSSPSTTIDAGPEQRVVGREVGGAEAVDRQVVEADELDARLGQVERRVLASGRRGPPGSAPLSSWPDMRVFSSTRRSSRRSSASRSARSTRSRASSSTHPRLAEQDLERQLRRPSPRRRGSGTARRRASRVRGRGRAARQAVGRLAGPLERSTLNGGSPGIDRHARGEGHGHVVDPGHRRWRSSARDGRALIAHALASGRMRRTAPSRY